MKPSVGAAFFVAAGLLLAGCGAGGGRIPQPTRSVLRHDVDAIRAAVDSGGRDRIDRALGTLTSDVARLQASGNLSAAQARRVRSASDDLVRQLGRTLPAGSPPATSSPTTTTTTTAPVRGGGGEDSD